MHHQTIALSLPFVLFACGGGQEDSTPPGRAITTLTLTESIPLGTNRFTGIVEPYRESQIGFEVAGRVEYVLDLGREVEGAILDADGELLLDEVGTPVQPGDILAVIDPTRYEQQVESLELRIASSHLNLAAQVIDLEEVAKQDVESVVARASSAQLKLEAVREQVNAARASFDLAQSSLDRARELVNQGVQSQAELDAAVRDFETAQSTLAQAETSVKAEEKTLEAAQSDLAKARGTIKLKEAQIETTRSEIAQLEQELATVHTDLERCVLRAPFSGRITQLHVGRGTLVQAGTVVVTLTLLDPMKVAFTVSSEDDRRIRDGERLRIGVPGISENVLPGGFLPGIVREKGEVADPATRTFRIECLTRNRRHFEDGAAPGPRRGSMRDNLAPVLTRHAGEGGPLFVFANCLPATEDWVLRVPGWNQFESEGEMPRRFQPERVPLRLGDGYLTFLNWTFREVDAADLRTGDMLVVSPTAEDEEEVLLGRSSWLLRPGDLVRVGIDGGGLQRGIYVPVHAIREQTGRTSVFILDGDRVREEFVRVTEADDSRRRIEGEGIAAGMRIAVRGMHYLVDGATVDVTGEERD